MTRGHRSLSILQHTGLTCSLYTAHINFISTGKILHSCYLNLKSTATEYKTCKMYYI